MSEKPVLLASIEPHPNPNEDWHLRGCAAFDKRTAGAQKTRLGSLRVILTNARRMWDNGKKITCCFIEPAGTSQRNKVKEVVKEWETYVNIKFEFDSGRNATIRIAFNEDEGSWSYIARDVEGIPPEDPTMNFGWLTTDPGTTEEDRGVILQEFGHSLGYIHEHQSMRRSEKIPLDAEVELLPFPHTIILTGVFSQAVIEFYTKTQGWTPEVHNQILDAYDVNEISSFSSIDLTSIMMYFMPKEMNIERIEIKPNNFLSNLDKA